MGCHTWFYKRVEGISREEAADIVIQGFTEEVFCINSIIAEGEKSGKNLLETILGWSLEFALEQREIYEGYIAKAQSGDFTDEWIFTVCDLGQEGYYIPGKGWYEESDDLPHNLFRQDGYPDDCLLSLEETLEFIKRHNCETYDYTEKGLQDYWREYPNGMINFG